MLNKEGLWICSLERKCNDDDIVSLILSNFFIVFSILSFFQFKTLLKQVNVSQGMPMAIVWAVLVDYLYCFVE